MNLTSQYNRLRQAVHPPTADRIIPARKRCRTNRETDNGKIAVGKIHNKSIGGRRRCAVSRTPAEDPQRVL